MGLFVAQSVDLSVVQAVKLLVLRQFRQGAFLVLHLKSFLIKYAAKTWYSKLSELMVICSNNITKYITIETYL